VDDWVFRRPRKFVTSLMARKIIVDDETIAATEEDVICFLDIEGS